MFFLKAFCHRWLCLFASLLFFFFFFVVNFKSHNKIEYLPIRKSRMGLNKQTFYWLIDLSKPNFNWIRDSTEWSAVLISKQINQIFSYIFFFRFFSVSTFLSFQAENVRFWSSWTLLSLVGAVEWALIYLLECWRLLLFSRFSHFYFHSLLTSVGTSILTL